jgi:hypothetical protein
MGGSELRSDPDFLSGVPVEREPRWDASPERVTPPHPGNILIIEDDDSSLGEDPLGDDPLGVGRVCWDPCGEDTHPFEPYGEGSLGTPGSWADTPFDPSPLGPRRRETPIFPLPLRDMKIWGLWEPREVGQRRPLTLPPSGPGAGRPLFPPSPPGYEDLGATGGMGSPAQVSAGAGPGCDDDVGA